MTNELSEIELNKVDKKITKIENIKKSVNKNTKKNTKNKLIKNKK